MKKHHAVLGALALGVAGFAAGHFVATGSPTLPDGLLNWVRPAAAQSQRRPAQDDPVVFYRDPMGERVVSARPRQDSMGMDFLPVRRSEVAALLGRLPNPLPAPAAGEAPLFYRDPMGGSATATAPRKDSMGMDFLPIYPSQIAPVLPPLPQRRGDADTPEAAPQIAEAPTGTPPGDRRILYYRNPMGLPDTSPVPKKDSMGMDYLPVYEGEGNEDGVIKLSPGRIQRSGVRSEPVRRQSIVQTIHVPGVVQLDERRVSVVTIRADAFVQEVAPITTGDRVTRGTRLARIYSPEISTAGAQFITELNAAARGVPEGGARQRLENLGVPPEVIAEIVRSRKVPLTINWSAPRDGIVL